MAKKTLPRSISYTERDEKTKKRGQVTKEAWVNVDYKHGDYNKVLQEVHFDGDRRRQIRLGYYFKDHGAPDSEYRWGSQQTLIMTRSHFHKLLRRAVKQGIIDLSKIKPR